MRNVLKYGFVILAISLIFTYVKADDSLELFQSTFTGKYHSDSQGDLTLSVKDGAPFIIGSGFYQGLEWTSGIHKETGNAFAQYYSDYYSEFKNEVYKSHAYSRGARPFAREYGLDVSLRKNGDDVVMSIKYHLKVGMEGWLAENSRSFSFSKETFKKFPNRKAIGPKSVEIY